MTEILKGVAKKFLDYDIVLKVEFFGTKIRAYLVRGYIFDIYHNQTLGKYSYTLIKEDRRIAGWDNAPHHVSVETYPDHFHDVDEMILNVVRNILEEVV